MANDGNGTDPLLQHLISPSVNPPPSLFPSPDNNDVTVPMPMTPAEIKTRLIFGPISQDLSHSSSSATPVSDSLTVKPTHHRFRRSKSAPGVAAIDDLHHPVADDASYPTSKSTVVRPAVALTIVYLAVMSVATAVYGDQAFKTLPGWLLAVTWLFVSTLAAALVFFYLAEAIRDKRVRELQNRVLAQNMSISDFYAADIDNTGYLSISEYVIYKLTQIGKISVEDIRLISDQFDKMDRANSGKISLSDIIETSTTDLSTATSV